MNESNSATINTTEVDQKVIKALAAHQAEMKAAEQLLQTKYSHLNIKPGSLIQEADHPVYGNKRRVIVTCACGCEVERATSDLHTFIGCAECKKVIQKAAKAKKKLFEAEAIAALKAQQGAEAKS